MCSSDLTWTAVSGDLPGFGNVNSIRQDPVNKNLLFAPTELGFFISLNDGKNWHKFMPNLPTGRTDEVLVHPREHDLVLSTHSRSVWIMDDITALENLTEEQLAKEAALLPTRDAVAWKQDRRLGTEIPGDKWWQGENAPRIIVAGTRALLQKLAPGTADLDPITVTKGAVLDVDAVCEQLVHFGYRRENIVEHRGEFARRGAIIDVFPSTDDEPVRIDLWGDEVDRLTRFAIAEQRSTDDIDIARIFPARELLYTDDMRERARGLIASDPWGREQWERLAEGQIFDGMESWLPWLTVEDTLITDHIGDDALVREVFHGLAVPSSTVVSPAHLGMATAGVAPRVMGIGPVPATEKLSEPWYGSDVPRTVSSTTYPDRTFVYRAAIHVYGPDRMYS